MPSLFETYKARIRHGELQADEAQGEVARKLSALAEALGETQKTDGLLARVFGGGAFRANGGRPPDLRGLYIHGGVGRGKSMLMDLFFEAAPVKAKMRVHFHEFMRDVHGQVHDYRQRLDKQADPIAPVAQQIAERAQLLCFDEFQVNDITDAMILHRLFRALFGHGVVAAATSNIAPERLYEHGLNRQLFLPFIDLVHAHMEVIEIGGPHDYRLDRIRGLPVYHTPIDREARQAMQRTWAELTDDADGETGELSVKGRRIAIPRCAKGVARFQFDDLCERPLGASDYLALADRFHTVMLEDIPALTPARRNEARRFINLVDALYERKVKLVASAEVRPAKLYVSGDGALDFRRTASRLIEMQSATYLDLAHRPAATRTGTEKSPAATRTGTEKSPAASFRAVEKDS